MNMFSGVWVALVTPFSDGTIDEQALRNLVTDLVASGVSGFVPLGTTGEAATLSAATASKKEVNMPFKNRPASFCDL